MQHWLSNNVGLAPHVRAPAMFGDVGPTFSFVEWWRHGRCRLDSRIRHIGQQNILLSEIVILAVCFQLKQLKKQPEKKNSGLNGTRTHDLAIPVQCSTH